MQSFGLSYAECVAQYTKALIYKVYMRWRGLVALEGVWLGDEIVGYHFSNMLFHQAMHGATHVSPRLGLLQSGWLGRVELHWNNIKASQKSELEMARVGTCGGKVGWIA